MSNLIRLGDNTRKIGSGQTPSGGYRAYAHTGIPLIRSQNVQMGSFSEEGLVFITPAIDNAMSGSRVLPGEVLLNITGASIGRVCVVPAEICPANVNQHVCIIRCGDTLLPEYVATLLSSPQFQKLIWDSQAGGTRQALTKQMIEDFEVPLHPLDVQRTVATRLRGQLAELTTAIGGVQQRLQGISSLRACVLKQVFAGLQDAPHKVLGDHAPTTSGTTPSRGNKAYWSPAEVPWVKTGEVAFAPITATEEAVSRLALKECSLSLLPPKTVLVAMIGQGKTRGQSALLEIDATTNQNCFAVLPSETWQPEFLYYWFVANYQNLRNLSSDRGGSQSALNGGLLKALEVPAPEHDTQALIVDRVRAALAEVDTMQIASQQMLKDLEQLPQRILAQAFEN